MKTFLQKSAYARIIKTVFHCVNWCAVDVFGTVRHFPFVKVIITADDSMYNIKLKALEVRFSCYLTW